MTTGREPVSLASTTTVKRKAQASAAAVPRRTQRKRGSAILCPSFSRAVDRWAAPFRLRASARTSFRLDSTSSTSTDRNSKVETALISGVTRFLVMP